MFETDVFLDITCNARCDFETKEEARKIILPMYIKALSPTVFLISNCKYYYLYYLCNFRFQISV